MKYSGFQKLWDACMKKKSFGMKWKEKSVKMEIKLKLIGCELGYIISYHDLDKWMRKERERRKKRDKREKRLANDILMII